MNKEWDLIRGSQKEVESRDPAKRIIFERAKALSKAGVKDKRVAEEIARTLTEMGGPTGLAHTLRYRAQAEEEEGMMCPHHGMDMDDHCPHCRQMGKDHMRMMRRHHADMMSGDEEECRTMSGGEQEEEWTQLTPDQEEQIADMVNLQIHGEFPDGNYGLQDVTSAVFDILDNVPGLEDPEIASKVANRLSKKIFRALKKGGI